jgi:hypothetical protein
MSDFTGFVVAGAQIGLQSILIRPTRGIYGIITSDGKQLPDIIAQAVIEEKHHDELEITDHPVQQGAMISDHAYKRPAEVTLSLGWSNSPSLPGGLIAPAIAAAASLSPLASAAAGLSQLPQTIQGVQSGISSANIDQIKAIYQSLLQLQETRSLFVIYTGKRVYVNMVCKTLATESDFKSANSLPITMTCKQVILVNAQTIPLPQATQADPQLTSSTVSKGQVTATQVPDVSF